MRDNEELLIETTDKNNYAEIEREHIYENEKGEPVLRVLKNKTDNQNYKFVSQRYENGSWEYGIKNVKRIPYHLPQILEGEQQDKTIVICCGEKDADTISELSENFVGTTGISNGAHKWEYGFSSYFSGKSNVLILQDDTEEANKFALITQKNMSYKVKNIAVLKVEKLKKVLGFEIEEITDISELRTALCDNKKLVDLLNKADSQLRKHA